MDDERSGSTDAFGDDGLGIPEYVSYVVSLCRLVSTVFIVSMGSLVISTILQNRPLHNVHNVLIVNLMVADIVAIVVYAFQNIGMTVSYIIGVQDPFRCDMLIFFFFPINPNVSATQANDHVASQHFRKCYRSSYCCYHLSLCINDIRGAFSFKTYHIAQLALPQYVAASTGIWSVLQENFISHWTGG